MIAVNRPPITNNLHRELGQGVVARFGTERVLGGTSSASRNQVSWGSVPAFGTFYRLALRRGQGS